MQELPPVLSLGLGAYAPIDFLLRFCCCHHIIYHDGAGAQALTGALYSNFEIATILIYFQVAKIFASWNQSQLNYLNFW